MKVYWKEIEEALELLMQETGTRKKIQRAMIEEEERLLHLKTLKEINKTLKKDEQREKEGLAYIG